MSDRSAVPELQFEAVLLDAETIHPGGRDPHRLGEREEGQQERDDDAAEDDADPVRASAGANGPAALTLRRR